MGSYEKLKAWISVQKFPRHSSDVLTFILGVVLAWYNTGKFHWGILILGTLAVFLIANGIYLTNEVEDYESDKVNSNRIGGTDKGMGLETTGGTRVLVNGLLSRKAVYIAGIVCFLLCIPLGLIIYFGFHTGPLTLPLGIFGVIVTYSYSNPPIKASYHGMGELFMMMGYIALLFTAYYLIGGPSWFPIIASLPRIWTVGSLKFLRNIPDCEADRMANKRTSVVVIGKEKAAVIYDVMTVLALLGYIPIILMTKSVFVLLNIPAMIFLIMSFYEMIGGKWKEREHLVKACKYGFRGMLLIPALLILTYLLSGWLGI